MTPRIEEHPSFQIVGVPGRFTPATNTAQIPALWARFVPLMDTVAHRKGTLTFGVCLPSETAASGDDVDFTYVAAVEVDPLAEVPPEMYGGTIPGGTFAIFTHTGHISRIGETVRYVFGEWTPNNPEWEHRAAPDFERYDERFDPSTGEGAVDIFVPVRRRPR